MVYDSYEFGKYLTELRRKYNVSMNVVCDGICDQSVMSRIENGEREVSKLVQDRLLGRLGVAPENFENMVYADEYGYWKARQEIISLIQHEKMDEADKLLEKMAVQEKLFESGDAAENIDINLKLQFYMAMKAQIRCYNGAGDAELKKMYADASRLTVSRMKDRGSVKEFFSNRRLAVDEINLLLEYWRYVSPEIGKRFIRGAIEYIDKSLFDVLTKAKIYPKAVYYLCLLEIRTGLQNEKKINQLMNLVTQAIEALRNCLRAFYLCELLDIKIELLRMNNKEDVSYWDSLIQDMEQDTLIDENYDKLYGNTDEFSAEAQYIWCRYTRNVLGEIYKRCGVREDTFEYSHIYVDREVYCIEDIIRIRRKMLNMSMYKLGDGICSERTIKDICSRLESRGMISYMLSEPSCTKKVAQLPDSGGRRISYEIMYSIAICGISYTWYIDMDFFERQTGTELRININSKTYLLGIEDGYMLKLQQVIEDCIGSDWGTFVRIVDAYSDMLNTLLYPDFHRVENSCRRLVSGIMTNVYGAMWWKNGESSSSGDFAVWDDTVFGMNIMDFEKIMTSEWEHTFSRYLPEDYMDNFHKLADGYRMVLRNHRSDKKFYMDMKKIIETINRETVTRLWDIEDKI